MLAPSRDAARLLGIPLPPGPRPRAGMVANPIGEDRLAMLGPHRRERFGQREVLRFHVAWQIGEPARGLVPAELEGSPMCWSELRAAPHAPPARWHQGVL